MNEFEIYSKFSFALGALIISIFGFRATKAYNENQKKITDSKFKKEVFDEFENKFFELYPILLFIIENGKKNEEYNSFSNHNPSYVSNLIKMELPSRFKNQVNIDEVIREYLRLCGKQFYWNSLGYVDNEVWESWKLGMKKIIKTDKIKKILTDEDGSLYYLNEIDKKSLLE